MMKKFFAKIKSDKADSLVSAVIILPMMFFMLITTVDFGVYMSNRATIQAVARDGARTVAIMGGDGTASTGTPLEAAYGQSRSTSCDSARKGIASNAVKNSSSAIDCSVMGALNNSTGLVNVEISSVNCGPNISSYIGQRAFCEIKWSYGGIPGSAMSFTRADNGEQILAGQNTTAGSAETEVKFAGTGDLVVRK